MSIGDPQGSVEFERAPIGPRRPRLDPVRIGVAIVVVALLVAIVKPWERPTPGEGAVSSDAAASASAAVPSSDAAVSASPIDSGAPGPPDDAASIAGIAAAMRPHDAWGIRAIVATPADEERWVPVDPGSADGRSGEIGSRDEPITALGVTTPRAQTPLDVRVWRPTDDGDVEWLDVRPIPPELVGGELLLWPPGSDGSQSVSWPAGRYRIDLLMGTTIQRVDVAIPGRFERVPADPAPSIPTGLVPAAGVVPADLPTGGFMVVDGIAKAFAPVPGPSIDPATAWLRPTFLTGDGGSWKTPSIRESRAAGLGVRFPVASHVLDAALTRIAPGPLTVAAAPVVGAIDDPAGTIPFVTFAAPEGRAWAPGDYAITATWADANGPHTDDWVLELRPGGINVSSVLVGAAQAFASAADVSTTTLRADVWTPAGIGGTSCDDARGETRFGEEPTVLGISHPVDTIVSDVTASLALPGGQSRDIPLRVVPEALPGVTLVEAVSGGSLPPGQYRLRVQETGGPQRLTICLGSGPFDG